MKKKKKDTPSSSYSIDLCLVPQYWRIWGLLLRKPEHQGWGSGELQKQVAGTDRRQTHYKVLEGGRCGDREGMLTLVQFQI